MVSALAVRLAGCAWALVLATAAFAQTPAPVEAPPPPLPAPSTAPAHVVGRIATVRVDAPCVNFSMSQEPGERWQQTITLSFTAPAAFTELFPAEPGGRPATAERNVAYMSDRGVFEGTRLFTYVQARGRERRVREFDHAYRTRASWHGATLEFAYDVQYGDGTSPFGDPMENRAERLVRVAFREGDRCEVTFAGQRQRLVYGDRTLVDRWCSAAEPQPNWSCAIANRPR